MRKIWLLLLALTFALPVSAAPANDGDTAARHEQQKDKKAKKEKKKKHKKEHKKKDRAKKKKNYTPTPITPGSQVLIFKNDIKVEVRPDDSVWWFGANHRKALVEDGTHPLKEKGRSIVTKNGKWVKTTGFTLVRNKDGTAVEMKIKKAANAEPAEKPAAKRREKPSPPPKT